MISKVKKNVVYIEGPPLSEMEQLAKKVRRGAWKGLIVGGMIGVLLGCIALFSLPPILAIVLAAAFATVGYFVGAIGPLPGAKRGTRIGLLIGTVLASLYLLVHIPDLMSATFDRTNQFTTFDPNGFGQFTGKQGGWRDSRIVRAGVLGSTIEVPFQMVVCAGGFAVIGRVIGGTLGLLVLARRKVMN